MKRYIHTIDIVFVLVTFCIFAVSVLIVLMTGAKAYGSIRNSMEDQYSERTCVNYISAKVRHFDENNAVYLDEMDGVPVLCLENEFDGSTYVTYIYYYEGQVRELYTDPNLGLGIESGTSIIDVSNLSFSQVNDSLISVNCTGSGGNTSTLYISTRCGEVAG